MKDLIISESQNGNKYAYNTTKKQLYNIDEDSFEALSTILENNIPTSNMNESFLRKYDLKLSTRGLNYLKTKFFNVNTTDWDSKIETEISEDILKYYLSNYPQIVFEVTEKCNLKCKYCTYGDFYDENDTRTNLDLDTEAAKLLVQYVYDYCTSNYAGAARNVITISFYGGEPLLRYSFIEELIVFTKQLKVENVLFQFVMTTNATLLNRHIDFLVQNKFRLLISLDGNEDNHSYRIFKNRKNSFKTVIKNIQFVKNRYPEFFLKNINFNAVLHNRNSVSEINEFIKTNFDKNPMVAEITTDGLKEERKSELLKLFKNKSKDLEQSEDYFRILYDENMSEIPDFKEAMYFIYNLSNLVYSNYLELFLDRKKVFKPTGTCIPFARKIFVTAAGKILPCENVSHKFAFGSVTRDGVNIDLQALKETYTNYLKKMKNLCNRCYRVGNCAQCMFYLNINDENVKCYGFMNKKGFEKYLSRIVTYFENNPKAFRKIIDETSLS